MQRTARTNLLLIAVAGVLGLAVYWQVKKETAGFEAPLSNLDPTRVERVSASCRACTERRFERRDGHWWMLEPYALPASDAMVERLIGIAASPVRSRRPLTDLDPAKIGLDPPLMQLELDGRRFEFGMTDVLQGDRYVRSDDAVAMVPDRFSPFLSAAPESELDRALVPRGSVVITVAVDGVELTGLSDAWSKASAGRIRVADDYPQAARSSRVRLAFADGSGLEYVVDSGSEPPVAWRSQPRVDAASMHASPPLPESTRAGTASDVLGFELDPSLLPALLGDATEQTP